MALKALLSSLDGLSDDIAKEYTEREDGKFILAVDGVDGYALEDVQGLKGSLAKERQNVASFEREIEKTKEAYGDITPEIAAQNARRVEEMKNWSPDEKTKELIADKERTIKSGFEEKIAQANKRSEELEQQISRELVDSRAMAAIVQHGGKPKLLLPHLREISEVKTDEDGKFGVRILNEKGEARISMREGSTDFMGYDEYVASMAEQDEWGGAFKPSDARGVGSRGSENHVQNSGRSVRATNGVVTVDPMQIMSGEVSIKD